MKVRQKVQVGSVLLAIMLALGACSRPLTGGEKGALLGGGAGAAGGALIGGATGAPGTGALVGGAAGALGGAMAGDEELEEDVEDTFD